MGYMLFHDLSEWLRQVSISEPMSFVFNSFTISRANMEVMQTALANSASWFIDLGPRSGGMCRRAVKIPPKITEWHINNVWGYELSWGCWSVIGWRGTIPGLWLVTGHPDLMYTRVSGDQGEAHHQCRKPAECVIVTLMPPRHGKWENYISGLPLILIESWIFNLSNCNKLRRIDSLLSKLIL